MVVIESEEVILNDIIKTCKRIFGFQILEVSQIKRGWLNLKWKITTSEGTFLVKQYNKERFKLYNQEELLLAFSQQQRLHNQGFPCPRLLSYQGKVMFETNNGELFIVMEFCNGQVVPPGNMNTNQMYDLGRFTGLMHHVLNDGTILKKKVTNFTPPSREDRMEYWNSVLIDVNNSSLEHLVPIMERQYQLTKELSIDEFSLIEAGWAHRDLWADNLLFEENHLGAILDFDRLNYDYPQLDIGRAIISCSLNENSLKVDTIEAFKEGYCEHILIDSQSLISSLRFLWYLESTWWIKIDMDQFTGPPTRFKKEMLWLSDNYNELDSLLGGC
ncbi:phosphotransferase [Lederbergia wuyishanensis]|uniref:Homoserine kinase type II n=1 Tax=Lederbergia wuyishanensis TaxID=1347903 RepID=A0ABU0D6F6_9BACI|nr:phosphotransferase [Lederbergia wuyishanensis]MCJ8008609.1 phosphotransferase [Lederbergia wuyishanensis]MDQ0343975.1 homoserine kinase type II [Lederbergia wuyishanensis]